MHVLPPLPHLRARGPRVSRAPSFGLSVSLKPAGAHVGRHEDLSGPRGLSRDMRERAVVQLPLGGGGQPVQAHIRGPAALIPRVAATALSRTRAGRFRGDSVTRF